ncbi:hypothetical protein Tco_1135647 [Tanacetum coccineum]
MCTKETLQSSKTCTFQQDHSTKRGPNVPIATMKLCIYHSSIEGAARLWLRKRTTTIYSNYGTDDLVSKFINQFFLLLRTNDDIRTEFTRFTKQVENFLDKMPRECLKIIESKSKVRQTRAKAVIAKVSTNSSTQTVSPDVAELKDIVRALLLDKKEPQASAEPIPASCTCQAFD